MRYFIAVNENAKRGEERKLRVIAGGGRKDMGEKEIDNSFEENDLGRGVFEVVCQCNGWVLRALQYKIFPEEVKDLTMMFGSVVNPHVSRGKNVKQQQFQEYAIDRSDLIKSSEIFKLIRNDDKIPPSHDWSSSSSSSTSSSLNKNASSSSSSSSNTELLHYLFFTYLVAKNYLEKVLIGSVGGGGADGSASDGMRGLAESESSSYIVGFLRDLKVW
jgi:hypothetical protein